MDGGLDTMAPRGHRPNTGAISSPEQDNAADRKWDTRDRRGWRNAGWIDGPFR